VEQPINIADYEKAAAGLLEPGPLGYFAGGAGDERTLRDNVEAFRRWQLRPRTLVDISEASARTTVLGTEVSMPMLVAPVAIQRLAHPEGEVAMARAAAAVDTIMCLSSFSTTSPPEVAAAAPDAPRWLQLYCFRDAGVTRALIDQAVEFGYRAIAVTVDAPRPGRRERDLRSGFVVPEEITVPALADAVGQTRPMTIFEAFGLLDPTLTWRELEAIATESPLPVLVKGVLTEEDARLAIDHGAAGVVVSNHGGRQLDGVAASLDALPEVVEAIGDRGEVLVDGGIRRGTDVVIALALGASAVLVGRPALWGLAVDGEAGATHALELLRAELELALALCGCPTPADVTAAHVRRAGA
jgi:isopentenyl diphosphate isomerase/L-lactate dehydrogenase-like FMN-dependent dehydrogenase